MRPVAASPPRGARDPRADVQAEVEEVLQIGERIRAELGALEEQRALLAEVVSDYQRGRDALAALAGASGDVEVLVPLGGGNFVSGKLAGGSKVVSSIGSGVHVESSIADAIARVSKRLESAEQSSARLAEEVRRLSAEMGRVNAHLEGLASASRGA